MGKETFKKYLGTALWCFFTLTYLFSFCEVVAQQKVVAQPVDGKPNILFIISDDLNTRIGPYMGISEHTPHLDRLAGEGVKFMRAYAQYPQCGASRASIMSGLYPETNGVLSNYGELGSYKKKTPALKNHPSLAGFFREQGYFTARVSKIFHMGVPGDIEQGQPGGDEPESWDYAYNIMAAETGGPGKLELLSPKNLSYGSNFARMVVPDKSESTQADYLAASQAIAILENRAGELPSDAKNKQRIKKDAPFFLAVGFIRPHVPLIAPENSFALYPEDEVKLPEVQIGKNVPKEALRQLNQRGWGMNEQQQKQAISSYMASVHFMDQQVGRLLDALDRLDLRKNTIVIFLSDHGYNLGEHDSWSKSSLWEGSVRAPLIISVPGYEKNHGLSSKPIVQFLDLYPTLTELSGLSTLQPSILQGKSMVPLLMGDEFQEDSRFAYTVTNKGEDGSLRTDRWRYNRWGKGIGKANEELYDHDNDPEEFINLADNSKFKNVLQEMRMKFDAVQTKAQLDSKNL